MKYPLFSLAKQPEPEADYSSSSSAAVMNKLSCDSIPHVPSCCAQVQIYVLALTEFSVTWKVGHSHALVHSCGFLSYSTVIPQARCGPEGG